MNKLRNLILLFVVFIIAYLTSSYFIEKNKWLNDNHPYSNAKEYLIKANMIMMPIKFLHSLPLINEKSFILQPLLEIQNTYIKQWQDNIPNNDAEKYLAWYLFRLNSLIIPNLKSMALYKDNFYSFEEVRSILDKIWNDIEKLANLKAKDKEFEEMRYIAFMKLSFLYVRNLISYWSDENRNFNHQQFINDDKKLDMLIKLDVYIKNMSSYYKKSDKKIYNVASNNRVDYARTHTLMYWILNYYNDTNKYKEFDGYCNINKNYYLKKYLNSRNKLIDMLNKGDTSVDNTLSDYTDNNINNICSNIHLKKGIKYE